MIPTREQIDMHFLGAYPSNWTEAIVDWLRAMRDEIDRLTDCLNIANADRDRIRTDLTKASMRQCFLDRDAAVADRLDAQATADALLAERDRLTAELAALKPSEDREVAIRAWEDEAVSVPKDDGGKATPRFSVEHRDYGAVLFCNQRPSAWVWNFGPGDEMKRTAEGVCRELNKLASPPPDAAVPDDPRWELVAQLAEAFPKEERDELRRLHAEAHCDGWQYDDEQNNRLLMTVRNRLPRLLDALDAAEAERDALKAKLYPKPCGGCPGCGTGDCVDAVDAAETQAWDALGRPDGTHDTTNAQRLCEAYGATKAKLAALVEATAEVHEKLRINADGKATVTVGKAIALRRELGEALAAAKVQP